MDASKITELRQKQITNYINRSQTVDSSTMTWMRQIQSSKYIKGVATCGGLKNPNNPVQRLTSDGNGGCNYGGGGKQMNLITGSTEQYPSVFAGAAGSASQVYSSEKILLRDAGINYCATICADVQNQYTVINGCYCDNTNGPTKVNPTPDINNSNNPYLPPFDTYYKFKNPLAQITSPIPDQNQKHFVKQCHTRFPDAKNGVSVTCVDCGTSPKTCDTCILQQ